MPKYALPTEVQDEIARRFAEEKRNGARGWIMTTIGVLSVVTTLTLFVFKTNAAADVEHANMRSEVAVEKVKISAQEKNQAAILRKLDVLHANQIRIGERLQVRGLARDDE